MDRFTIIEDACVILLGKKGIYRQAKLYRRGEKIYAGYGGGFIRLIQGGSTTNPDVRYQDIEGDGVVHGLSGAPSYRAAAA